MKIIDISMPIHFDMQVYKTETTKGRGLLLHETL